LASGFGKNPKWEDMMQELNLVVGPEVGPLLKLTKNGKTVQDPGLIHEKEMFRDIVKYPEVVHVNRRKENHPTKSIKNGITKRRKAKSDGIILPLRHHRAVTTTMGRPQILPWNF
jgi:hypothetical protein